MQIIYRILYRIVIKIVIDNGSAFGCVKFSWIGVGNSEFCQLCEKTLKKRKAIDESLFFLSQERLTRFSSKVGSPTQQNGIIQTEITELWLDQNLFIVLINVRTQVICTCSGFLGNMKHGIQAWKVLCLYEKVHNFCISRKYRQQDLSMSQLVLASPEQSIAFFVAITLKHV